MDNEKLYQLFFDDLTAPLAAKITPEFKEKFLALMIKKRGSLYLKNEELALDMANHCNLCQELVFPLYLQDNVVRIKVDLGLNYFSDQMLAQCNRALNNHQFTIYKIEETDPNRVKLHTKIP